MSQAKISYENRFLTSKWVPCIIGSVINIKMSVYLYLFIGEYLNLYASVSDSVSVFVFLKKHWSPENKT